MSRSTTAVGAACALGAICLAGSVLYASAAASAAVQDQLSATCAVDAGFDLPLAGDSAVDHQIVEAGRRVPHTEPPVTNALARASYVKPDGLAVRIVLLARDGAGANVTPPFGELRPGEVAMSSVDSARLGFVVGDTMQIATSLQNGSIRRFTIAHVFDDLALPGPPFWCGTREFRAPNARGDLPPPLLIVSPEEIQPEPGWTTFHWAEFTPQRSKPLTMREFRDFVADVGVAQADIEQRFGAIVAPLQPGQSPTLLRRAESLSRVVATSLAPARLAGVAAALVALLVASALLASEWSRELRLRALRGVPPWRTAVGLTRRLAPAVVAGSALGWALAFVGVRAMGPASVVEAAAVIAALIAVAAMAVVALILTAVTIASIGDRQVDALSSTARWLRTVPWEWSLAAVAVVSVLRLRARGGLRLSGVDVRGGDLLTLAAPLLCVIGVLALLARPAMVVLGRARMSGRRLSLAARLGWRRLTMAPLASVGVALATALGCGCYTLSNVLADSARQQLVDKATNFVGSTMAIDVIGDEDPPSWLGPASSMVTVQGRVGSAPVDVVGFDPVTAGSVAGLRGDASSQSWAQLMAAIATPVGAGADTGSAPLPGIVVGAGQAVLPVGHVVEVDSRVGGGHVVDVRGAATARWFPGINAASPTVVVDRAALTDRFDAAKRTWLVADPPSDAVARLRAEGVVVTSTREASRIFDAVTYRSLGRSFQPLRALGVLFAVVAAVLQLAVVEARGPRRRVAHVLLRRMGSAPGSVRRAALVETAVPVVSGAVTGVLAAVAAAHLTVTHLDAMPRIPPPATVVIRYSPLFVLAVVLAATSAVVVALTVRNTRRADPMEVLRATP